MIRRQNKQRRTHGYSLIEVMTAVAVMTVGSAGILLMQGASVRANQDANESTVALAFATTWVERIKRDALAWQSEGEAALTGTTYLSTFDGSWFVPTPGPSMATVESCSADYSGYDTVLSNMRAHYVAAVRNVVYHQRDVAMGALSTNEVQVNVRVSWPRASNNTDYTLGTFNDPNPCSRILTDAEIQDPRIRTVYLSTVVHTMGN